MNDAAMRALAIAHDLTSDEQPEKLIAGLHRLIERGIERRNQVLTWANSRAVTENATEHPGGLTGWEASNNWVPLEGFIGVQSNALYGPDNLPEGQQQILLHYGIEFLLKFTALAQALDPPVPLRCILAGSERSVTFRFHQIRPAETWDPNNPWNFSPEKVIVADIAPEPR